MLDSASASAGIILIGFGIRSAVTHRHRPASASAGTESTDSGTPMRSEDTCSHQIAAGRAEPDEDCNDGTLNKRCLE